MYERIKVDVDMLNALKSVGQHTLYGVQHIHINLTLIHCTFYCHADQNQFSQGLVFHCINYKTFELF